MALIRLARACLICAITWTIVGCWADFSNPPVDDGALGPVDASSDARTDASTDGTVPVPDQGIPDLGGPDCIGSCTVDDDGDLFSEVAGDCDDSDPLAKPGQDVFQTEPSVGGTYDFNCDGVVERMYGLVACEAATVETCDEASGLSAPSPVACGDSAIYIPCAAGTGTCAPVFGPYLPRTQACL